MRRDSNSQRSDRLTVTQLTVPLTTHSLASRPANRATAVRSAPVLTAAPSIRVAPTRHASARLAPVLIRLTSAPAATRPRVHHHHQVFEVGAAGHGNMGHALTLEEEPLWFQSFFR